MKHDLRLSLSVALVLALSPSRALALDQVWVVDDTPARGADFLDIQPAVDAASDGDLILVKSGSYSAFAVNAKSLSIVGEAGSAISVSGTCSVASLAPGQAVLLRGIDSIEGATDPIGEGMRLEHDLGRVWIEDCRVIGGSGSPALLIDDSTAVTLVRVSLLGGAGADLYDEKFDSSAGDGGAGLVMIDSSAAVFDCQIEGSIGGDNMDTTSDSGGDGGHGAELRRSALHASRTSFNGGAGGSGGWGGIFSSCGPGGAGGHGLFLAAGNPTVSTLACTSRGGPGGTPGFEETGSGFISCSWGKEGLGVSVSSGAWKPLSGPACSLEARAPTREGEAQILEIEGAPGTLVFAVVSASQGHTPLERLGVLVVGAPTSVIGIGSIPATGALTHRFPASRVGPSAEHVRIHAQGLAFDPVTSELALGAPSALVVLDQSL